MTSILAGFLRSRTRGVAKLVPLCLNNMYELNSSIPALGTSYPDGTTQSVTSRKQGGAVRGFSEELRVINSLMSEADYHHAANDTLDAMVEKLEAYVESNDVDGGDVEYSQGVLTVKLGNHGTFVINKQTPNRQIWLSSPVSGPFRFDYTDGRWIYSRDRRDLVRQLEQEISSLVGAQLRLD